MIVSMKLKNYKKCRLWVNERDELLVTKAESIENKDIPSCAKKPIDIKQIALELSLPKNHSNYALIGFEYNPSNTNQSTTNIAVFINNEQLYYQSETLSDSHDKVLIGISEEYGQSILKSAVETLNDIGGFPSGEINFNVGAHAECGSSNAIFSQATRMILKLSQLDLINMTELEIQNKIESML
ncbi:hypothetical protein CSC2_26770 [Clostridium zeae]|uniref:Uncharacterized protein n=1 Tax=Clostridium zeae TaxID=2759022 RepID=A0ABQ1EBV6_9CLOT|nr:hypothetical protein [Clostridium zeae]GFZ32151.1 hypothetical protein CSC2_26770 [Clostridium zeae]